MVKTESERFSEGVWVKKVSSFYANSQIPAINNVFKKAEEDFEITIKRLKKQNRLDELKKDKDYWRGFTGDFGEVMTCWHLKDKVMFVRLMWAERPLNPAKGIDIIGLTLKDHKLCFAESKFRNSNKKEDIEKTSLELSDQLLIKRFEEKLNNPHYRFQSSQWIKNQLKAKIKEKKLNIDEKILEEIINTKECIRFGSVVRPNNNLSINFKEAIDNINTKDSEETTSTKWNEVVLIDLLLDDINLELESFFETIENANAN